MYKDLRPLFFFLFFFSTTLSLYSQQIIRGTVTSTEGEPLIGVSVAIKGASGGATTDASGQYKISVVSLESATLTFHYIGFLTQEIPVSNRLTVDVVLEENTAKLGEVVVTAFGIQRQKREVGYSTEKVKGDEVARSNAPNLVNALSGKMAGVNVTQPNGVEGGSTRIVIRGNNNITGNNQPLIIVDGVPLENAPGYTESPDRKEITGGRDWGSAINNINPADIESIDVLKGANAAALYGARGKNGVILISLKKGKGRKGLGVDYSFFHRSIQPFRYRDVQNTFGAGGPVSENAPSFALDTDGTPLYPQDIYSDNGPGGANTTQSFGYYGGSQSWGPRMDGTLIRWWDGQMRPFDPQPDNLKLFYKNGHTTTHNLAFSGGGPNGTIRASLTRTDHDAVTPNSEYNQNTVSVGGALQISPKLKTEVSLNYIDYNRHNTPALSNDGSYSFESGIVYSYPRSYKGENFDYQNADGTRKTFEHWPYYYVNRYQIWNVNNHNTELSRDKWIGSLALNYDLLPWLSLMGRAGVDNTNDEFETRRKPIDITGILIDDGSAGYGNYIGYEHSLGKEKVLNTEFLLNAHKQGLLRKLDASLRFGGNQWQRKNYTLSGSGAPKWRDPFLYYFDNYKYDPPVGEGDLPRITESFYNKKINSLYAFLDLGYHDFLFLQLTGRNDWSSTLPLDNNSYFYPSANLSFVATEAFRNKIPAWVSHLKVRAAASQTATDDEPYQLSKIYISGVFNGNNTGSLPTNIPPIALRPQRALSYEGGLEMGFWDDRFTADLTYYYIHSYDQLLSSPVPTSSGFNNIRINTGQLDNRGIEAIVSARVLQSPHFSWKTGFTYARNRNKLVKLDEGAEVLELANVWASNGPSISVKAGQPYGIIVGFDYVRDEKTGKPIVSDDGKFFKLSDTKTPIKIYDDNGKFLRYANATPKFTGGWTNTLSWKGLTLSTLIDVKWGGDMWFGSYALNLQSGQSPETLNEREGNGLPFTDPSGATRNVGVVLDGVYADGTPNTKVVHYYYKYLNAGGWGRASTTPAVRENSWIKCREISLAYQLPARWIDKSRVFKGLTIALTGRDLFYLYETAPDNINPEGSIGAGNAQGLEFASLPGMRSFGLSANASF